ncbi:MAG: zinc metalloprotease HtpX [Magnetovibrio sp.]|nr:zinc metalloprotease HtpX [Magnetovibrio sp.]
MKLHNLFHTILMLIAMAALLAVIGYILAGRDGLIISTAFAISFMVFGRGHSTRLMLRAIGAVRLRPDQAPVLHAIAEELSVRAGLHKVPALHVIDANSMLGFSAGLSHQDASIVLSAPLVQRLSAREIAGVLAHEISHIVSGDLAVMAMADTFTRMTRMLSLLGLMLFLFNIPLAVSGEVGVPWGVILLLATAPLMSFVMQMTLSRLREFEADHSAVNISGDPEGLIRALEKLETQNNGFLRHAYFPHRSEMEPSLLRSHPITQERVRRLANEVPTTAPLPDELIGQHHGYPGQDEVQLTIPIRWLLRWWR